jgi:hypothetical protein
MALMLILLVLDHWVHYIFPVGQETRRLFASGRLIRQAKWSRLRSTNRNM